MHKHIQTDRYLVLLELGHAAHNAREQCIDTNNLLANPPNMPVSGTLCSRKTLGGGGSYHNSNSEAQQCGLQACCRPLGALWSHKQLIIRKRTAPTQLCHPHALPHGHPCQHCYWVDEPSCVICGCAALTAVTLVLVVELELAASELSRHEAVTMPSVAASAACCSTRAMYIMPAEPANSNAVICSAWHSAKQPGVR